MKKASNLSQGSSLQEPPIAGSPPRPKRVRYGPWLLFISLVILGCLLGVILQVKIFYPYDKLAHIGFFCAVSASLYLVMPTRKLLLTSILIALAAGSEFAQSLTPLHVASYSDFAADLVGIGLFFGGAFVVGLFRRGPQHS